ncbi:saccharopine dehydrogenase (NAD+, L-lysine-forming) [Sulfitobacter marinus]|uniref:Saccharopine dehydrogenase [NAD(+), L-lysine-forming] n=1 Tax=Sulfitobacter marinus TaxID=394264 RepID=A0A1I6TNV5_9RHOB|nr:saccharopine dehydrogenase [Sulfitobacter marinus]SFS90919.1 saccharopine dehydrogenase (NAD+, L-lysine-forming) [Sulfitobacter marinus]
MTHLWVRAEQRDNETRVGITPEGAASLLERGFEVTVEASDTRVIPTDAYAQIGCTISPQFSWPDAPSDAIIFGLKELPADGHPLTHQHIMFGHAYKGQSAGRVLLERFKAGGGTLYDLEYLTDDTGRRVAAFGYWAGFAGAAVAVKCWAAQIRGEVATPITPSANADELTQDLRGALAPLDRNHLDALVIGALGRVGTGASDLCKRLDIPVTSWDMAETASGGPFPEILNHTLFFNCILAGPNTPVFVPKSALTAERQLHVVGDIACDPDSTFNPVPIYSEATSWETPALRVHEHPPLDVTAIDNLPSMLPLESSEDYAAQLLPTLQGLAENTAVWQRAKRLFDEHLLDI